MSVKELKEMLQLNSTHFLNVYFASSVREELAGAATWPWDKDALSHLGKPRSWVYLDWGLPSVTDLCKEGSMQTCRQHVCYPVLSVNGT